MDAGEREGNMSEYNYASFPLTMGGEDFARFPGLMEAGMPAPDGELVNAVDGRPVVLSDYWSEGPLVVEFGSIT